MGWKSLCGVILWAPLCGANKSLDFGPGSKFLEGHSWISNIPRDQHLFAGVPSCPRGEHTKSSWQAERRKDQVGRFLQILEQHPAKFVHTLWHQQRRWQFICIIVGHHFCHLRSWNLGTIFIWHFLKRRKRWRVLKHEASHVFVTLQTLVGIYLVIVNCAKEQCQS